MANPEIRLILGIAIFVAGVWLTRRSYISLRDSTAESVREVLIDILFDFWPGPVFALLLLVLGGGLIASFWSAAA